MVLIKLGLRGFVCGDGRLRVWSEEGINGNSEVDIVIQRNMRKRSVSVIDLIYN